MELLQNVFTFHALKAKKCSKTLVAQLKINKNYVSMSHLCFFNWLKAYFGGHHSILKGHCAIYIAQVLQW